MRETVSAFRANCADLRAELDLAPVLGDALAQAHSEDKHKLSSLMARSKRQSYVNGIISIYGLLEESVDMVVMEVADAYRAIFPSHGEMPERTRASYRELSLRALLDKDRVRLRRPVDEAAVLHSLASNASNHLAPQLASPVFTYATANYRFKYVVELLGRVDVDLNTTMDFPALQRVISDSGLDFRGIDGLLADLAYRRNEVAHSYTSSELNMLDLDLLRAYLDVVQAFVEELLRTACERVLRCLTQNQLSPIGKVAQVWTAAIGVDMESGDIQAPCKVVLVRDSGISVVVASSLQSNNVALNGRVHATSETLALGMAFEGSLTAGCKGAEVFVLPERWAYLSIF